MINGVHIGFIVCAGGELNRFVIVCDTVIDKLVKCLKAVVESAVKNHGFIAVGEPNFFFFNDGSGGFADRRNIRFGFVGDRRAVLNGGGGGLIDRNRNYNGRDYYRQSRLRSDQHGGYIYPALPFSLNREKR